MFVGVALLCVHLTRSIRIIEYYLRATLNAAKHLREMMILVARPSQSRIEEKNGSVVVDPIGEEVSRLMQERQKRSMQTCCVVICHAVSVFLISVIYNIFTKSQRWASLEQLIVLLILLSFALALDWLSRFDHQIMAYWAYSIFMALSAVWIVAGDFSSPSAASSGEVTLYTLVAACALRLLATVNVLHFRLALFWNVMCSIVSSCKFVFAEAEGPFPRSNFAFLEAILCITVILLSEGIRSAKFAETIQEVNAVAGNIEKSAATSLLENVCDVILPLDPNLTISKDVPRFKGMLLLNPNSSVAGLNIDNYIPCQEDKTRLHQQITSSSPDEDSSVRCFNVTLRDSDGNDISVEMFSVAFESLNKSRRYMLGIREFSDLQVRPAPLLGTLDHDQPNEEPVELPHLSEPVEVPHLTQRITSSEGEMRVTESIGDEQSDVSSSADVEVASTSSAMVAPSCQLRETSERAKLVTTITLLTSWKIKTSQPWCCQMHAGLSEAKRMLKKVRKTPCVKDLHPNPEQCSACGVLQSFDHTGICYVCAHPRLMSL
eukprot:TRINITY_DN12021_c0_g1_i8.p1 TRINITY_DN12021_c0_g1~~TRINITY_DN12021_c0_g1_i8.p1  ORF type:complete len:573 (-),score=58.09 TRINITY_DN12021_c0_g1_i8:278-1918(-)